MTRDEALTVITGRLLICAHEHTDPYAVEYMTSSTMEALRALGFTGEEIRNAMDTYCGGESMP